MITDCCVCVSLEESDSMESVVLQQICSAFEKLGLRSYASHGDKVIGSLTRKSVKLSYSMVVSGVQGAGKRSLGIL